MTSERIAELRGIPPNNSIRATLMHECLEEIERLQAEVDRLRCVVLKDHKETCIHHNDKEREDAGCPVCVKAENARLKEENTAMCSKVIQEEVTRLQAVTHAELARLRAILEGGK